MLKTLSEAHKYVNSSNTCITFNLASVTCKGKERRKEEFSLNFHIVNAWKHSLCNKVIVYFLHPVCML